MSLGTLLLVLCAALLHATWNLIVKSSADTRLATAGMYLSAGLIAGAVLPFLRAPAAASWPYIGASTIAEVFYGLLLAAAYREGDLGHAYPLMRGTAPLLVALVSGTLIGEQLPRAVWIGIALVSGGVLTLIFDGRSRQHRPAATRLALLNAVVIAVYTTIDGLGVRRSGQPLAYSLWLFLLLAIPSALWMTPGMRTLPAARLRRQIVPASLGGLCTVASYTLALWAMTRASVASVAAVREISIVFGTVLAALVLHERLTWVRGLAAALITLGVWAIRAHGA
jgi:drug/metabolite transporter (DMT)-like permease